MAIAGTATAITSGIKLEKFETILYGLDDDPGSETAPSGHRKGLECVDLVKIVTRALGGGLGPYAQMVVMIEQPLRPPYYLPDGTLTERVAHCIFEDFIKRDVTLYCDLHTAGQDMRMIPTIGYVLQPMPLTPSSSSAENVSAEGSG